MMKKKQKEMLELREYNIEKRIESEQNFQKKIKFIQQEKDAKKGEINKKFKKLDIAKQQLDNSLLEYSMSKKEENAQKSKEHNKSFQKIQRARSAYKAHLCAKIMEKNIRGNEVIAMRGQIASSSVNKPLLQAASSLGLAK